MSRLSYQRSHHRTIPSQSGYTPAGKTIPAGHGQFTRPAKPADPRIETKPSLGGGLHRVRAADGVFQRRSNSRNQKGNEYSRPHSGQPHGSDAESVRFSAGSQ